MGSRPEITPDPLLDFVLRNQTVKTYHCSFQDLHAGYELLPRTVPDYNLIFVLRGSVVWVIEGEAYPLRPGDLVIVPPDLRHHGYGTARRIVFLSLHTMATLPGRRDVFALLSPARKQRIEPGTRLDQYLRGAAGEFGRRQPAETLLMLPHWLGLVVPELFLYDHQRGLLNPSTFDPLVAGMLKELSGLLESEVTLAALARRAGYSAQYLNRVFRNELGVTPLQYLARLRMERAAELLAQGNLTAKAIARKVGFDDPYYFSRQFRRHFGKSPQRYRASLVSDSPSQGATPPFPPRPQ